MFRMKVETSSTEKAFYPTDMVWGYLKHKFPILSYVALCILTIPHSNADEERFFRVAKKSKKTFCSNLDLKILLNSIMIIKMNKSESL